MVAKESTSVKQTLIGTQSKHLLIGGPLLLILGIMSFYLLNGRYQSTEDAYIQAAQVQISCNLSGRVTKVAVKDNQKVKAGDLLFQIDDTSFKIAIAEARAQLSSANLQVMALKATYQQFKANKHAAKKAMEYQAREFERQKSLASKDLISDAQLDQAMHAYEQAKSLFVAAQEQSLNILASLGQAFDSSDQDLVDQYSLDDYHIEDNPGVQQAQAKLDRALLNLSFTTVTAPIDGIVTKVEQLQVGSYVNASIPQFVLISDKNIWVEANFKENQLAYIREGQCASFTIDTYPGETFTGKVISVSPGTGSIFSILPPENATGNWVKVVQRLPVRLSIDHASINAALVSGLSVTVEIDTRTTFLVEHNTE